MPQSNPKSAKSIQTEKRGVGRPRKQVNAEQVLNLARIGCIQNEMALVLGCSVATLHRNYAEAIKRGWADLASSLRRTQIKVAVVKARPVMLIWLGKQLLGQRNEPSSTSQVDTLDQLLQEFRIHNARGGSQ